MGPVTKSIGMENLRTSIQALCLSFNEIIQGYFVNFIKTGNPNGATLPTWPMVSSSTSVPVMHIDVKTLVKPEQHRNRYLFFRPVLKEISFSLFIIKIIVG